MRGVIKQRGGGGGGGGRVTRQVRWLSAGRQAQFAQGQPPPPGGGGPVQGPPLGRRRARPRPAGLPRRGPPADLPFRCSLSLSRSSQAGWNRSNLLGNV